MSYRRSLAIACMTLIAGAVLGALLVHHLGRPVLFVFSRNGEEIELTLGVPVAVTSHVAKLYDKEYNATWSAREGSRFGRREVKSISTEQVVFVGDDGKELVVPVQ